MAVQGDIALPVGEVRQGERRMDGDSKQQPLCLRDGDEDRIRRVYTDEWPPAAKLGVALSCGLLAFIGGLTARAASDDPCVVARQAVALDWSRVSPEVLERCRLRGLETMLLQALIERNYAIVGAAGPDDVELTLPQRG